MLQGLPSTTGGARLDNPQHLRTHSYNFFVQDTWRVRPDLTLIAGLRYEYNSPPVDAARSRQPVRSGPQSLVQVGTSGIPRGGYDADRNNFAPRIGFRLAPGGQGKTVLRAGYGIYYDQSSLAPGEGCISARRTSISSCTFRSGASRRFAAAIRSRANFPVPMPVIRSGLSSGICARPYTQQWNFNLQQELGTRPDRGGGVRRVEGDQAARGARHLNQPRPSAHQSIRDRCRSSKISTCWNRAATRIITACRRDSSRVSTMGLAALASYTWSKSIDDGSSFFSSAGDRQLSAEQPQHAGGARALELRSASSVLAELLRTTCRSAREAARGGKLSASGRSRAGRPFTVALLPDFDNSNTGRSILGFGANDRPNVCGRSEAFRPTAATLVRYGGVRGSRRCGTFGNAGRNILTGPGYQSINVRWSRTRAIRETSRTAVPCRGIQPAEPHESRSCRISSSGRRRFGRIGSAGSPRRVQFGLKILF